MAGAPRRPVPLVTHLLFDELRHEYDVRGLNLNTLPAPYTAVGFLQTIWQREEENGVDAVRDFPYGELTAEELTAEADKCLEKGAELTPSFCNSFALYMGRHPDSAEVATRGLMGCYSHMQHYTKRMGRLMNVELLGEETKAKFRDMIRDFDICCRNIIDFQVFPEEDPIEQTGADDGQHSEVSGEYFDSFQVQPGYTTTFNGLNEGLAGALDLTIAPDTTQVEPTIQTGPVQCQPEIPRQSISPNHAIVTQSSPLADNRDTHRPNMPPNYPQYVPLPMPNPRHNRVHTDQPQRHGPPSYSRPRENEYLPTDREDQFDQQQVTQQQNRYRRASTPYVNPPQQPQYQEPIQQIHPYREPQRYAHTQSSQRPTFQQPQQQFPRRDEPSQYARCRNPDQRHTRFSDTNRAYEPTFHQTRPLNQTTRVGYDMEPMNQSNQANTHEQTALRKWMLNKFFDGATEDKSHLNTEDFLEAVKNYKESQGVADAVVLRNIAQSMIKEAKTWWVSRKETVHSLSEFETLVRRRFAPHTEDDASIIEAVVKKEQGAHEKLQTYVDETLALMTRAPQYWNEQSKISKLSRGMNETWYGRFVGREFQNLDAFLKYCSDLTKKEFARPKRVDVPKQFVPKYEKKVHTVRTNNDISDESESENSVEETDSEVTEREVNAMKKFARDKRHEINRSKNAKTNAVTESITQLNLKDSERLPHEIEDEKFKTQIGERAVRCFNCLIFGHHHELCPFVKRIFCYYCGKPGVTARECTICKDRRPRQTETKNESGLRTSVSPNAAVAQ